MNGWTAAQQMIDFCLPTNKPSLKV